MTDPRVQAVAFALADPSTQYPEHIRMALLGLNMIPIAEVAVKAINEYDEKVKG